MMITDFIEKQTKKRSKEVTIFFNFKNEFPSISHKEFYENVRQQLRKRNYPDNLIDESDGTLKFLYNKSSNKLKKDGK